MPLTRSRRRRGTSLGLAALLAAAALLGTLPASGQSNVDDKREEARQVAARLDELTAEYAQLSDRANEARAELAEVQGRIRQAQARLDDTIAERDQRRVELADYAVGAYLGGPDNSALSVAVDSRDQQEVPLRLGYLDTVTGNRAQLIDQLQATEEDVSIRVGELRENRDAAQELMDEVDAAAAEAQQAIDEQETLQSQIDAELEALIEQQRAEEAAARQAAIEAEIAAEVAAAPSAAAPAGDPAPTGGGTGGGTTPAPPPTPPPPASGAQGAVAAAMSMQGVPYVWGGASPSQGFDCSGLVMWAWAQAGRSLPHSSSAQYSVTRRISAAELQPGDLVFYYSPISHVAMYIGNGMIVHAPNSRSVVRTASMTYTGSPVGYGRP